MSSANQQLTGTFEVDGKRGFLRSPERNYAVKPSDASVDPELVRRYNLKGGETICGHVSGGTERRGRSSPRLVGIDTINDLPPDHYAELPKLTDLTPIDPCDPIHFETPGGPATMRVLDLLTPIGRGQRGLLVSPPRTGKTMLLEQMAAGVAANHPDIYVIVLLIDERPEEVTAMKRAVAGEVIASSNDRDLASHIRLARLGIAKAKRMVECGTHALILLDSLTRLGRAFNAHSGNSGRIMSGGLDSRALIEPKSIFGAARNIENGGSLTIMATALIDTGSRMDEVIFNEFKGTGNMEIVLSRELANKRIWPAIDLDASGTRKEELLLDADTLKVSHEIRRGAIGRPPDRAMEALLEQLAKYPDNRAFVAAAAK
ncbi:MAG: transcription termination factor Rho [Planctomycetes bacterium]|nr:transcription termination factor Rho [Planctomycetota bacterium]